MKKLHSFSLMELLVTICVLILISGLSASLNGNFSKKDKTIFILKDINEKLGEMAQMYKGYDEPIGAWPWNYKDNEFANEAILRKYILPVFEKHTMCKEKPLYCVGGFMTLDGEDYTNFRRDNEFARALVGKNNVHIALKTTGTCNPEIKNNLCGILVVDVDNKDGENKLGYDVFMFGFYSNGTFAPYGYEASDEIVDQRCSKYNSGDTCAQKIAKDGWIFKKIGTDKYPVE